MLGGICYFCPEPGAVFLPFSDSSFIFSVRTYLTQLLEIASTCIYQNVPLGATCECTSSTCVKWRSLIPTWHLQHIYCDNWIHSSLFMMFEVWKSHTEFRIKDHRFMPDHLHRPIYLTNYLCLKQHFITRKVQSNSEEAGKTLGGYSCNSVFSYHNYVR